MTDQDRFGGLPYDDLYDANGNVIEYRPKTVKQILDELAQPARPITPVHR